MSVIDIAKDLSEGLARAACAGEVDGEVVDLRTVVDHDAAVNILTAKDEKGLAALRHTTSHVMAQAVKRLYPNTKLAIGPSIADGFYYDMEFETPLTSDDFEKIEAEMKKIVKEDLKIERFTLPREKAIEFMKEKEEPYKVELIEDLPEGEEISFYQQGEFVDLCAGPHLMSTKEVGKAFKIMSLAGAYWRGDEHNQMLTRLYATAFAKKDELEAYITMMEEAKKRDHRKLGKELGLFMMHEAGPGFPFFLPKGMVLKNTLLDYWREIHRKAGYVEISTPVILNKSLWETSGHWDHYKNNMYTTVIDGEDYAIKPMNCPGGVLVYGIPEFRLPKQKVVAKEIEKVKELGVKFETNVVIGKSTTIDQLIEEEGFEAVFIGSGAGLPMFMGIPGENANEVFSANEYLTRSNLMKAFDSSYDTPIAAGKKVAVVGGGNVAMDAARTALRLGAEVHVVYRRSEAELPARVEEVHHAKEEGVIFDLLTNPKQINVDENGNVKSMTVIKMELGEPDASGRRRPVEIPGSEYDIDVDTVIMSLGTSPNPLISSTTKGLEVNRRKCIVAEEESGQTSKEGVYAGGDAVTGAATVILAMGAGKAGAKGIDEYLKNKEK